MAIEAKVVDDCGSEVKSAFPISAKEKFDKERDLGFSGKKDERKKASIENFNEIQIGSVYAPGIPFPERGFRVGESYE